jgi:DeoR/GlpR family transcriptional regulator of sugar metabolism
MAANSSVIVIAATKDKLGTPARFRVGAARSVTHLVVDQSTPRRTLNEFRAMSVKLRFA